MQTAKRYTYKLSRWIFLQNNICTGHLNLANMEELSLN